MGCNIGKPSCASFHRGGEQLEESNRESAHEVKGLNFGETMNQIIAGFAAMLSIAFTGYSITGYALEGYLLNNSLFKSLMAFVFLYVFMQMGKVK